MKINKMLKRIMGIVLIILIYTSGYSQSASSYREHYPSFQLNIDGVGSCGSPDGYIKFTGGFPKWVFLREPINYKTNNWNYEEVQYGIHLDRGEFGNGSGWNDAGCKDRHPWGTIGISNLHSSDGYMPLFSLAGSTEYGQQEASSVPVSNDDLNIYDYYPNFENITPNGRLVEKTLPLVRNYTYDLALSYYHYSLKYILKSFSYGLAALGLDLLPGEVVVDITKGQVNLMNYIKSDVKTSITTTSGQFVDMTVNQREYLKEQILLDQNYDIDIYLSMRGNSNEALSRHAVNLLGGSYILDPSVVDMDGYTLQADIVYRLFGVDYIKPILIVNPITDINQVIPFDEYVVYASELAPSGNAPAGLEKNVFDKIGDGVIKQYATSDMPNTFPTFEYNNDPTKWWNYGKVKTQEYTITLSKDDFAYVSGTLTKTIRVKVVEDRFNLKNKITAEYTDLPLDNGIKTIEINLCQYDDDYVLRDMFSSEGGGIYQGGRFIYAYASSTDPNMPNLSVQAVSGDGGSNFRVDCENYGILRAMYTVDSDLDGSFYSDILQIVVKVQQKPNLVFTIPTNNCTYPETPLENFVTKFVSKTPSGAAITDFKVNGQDADYTTYKFAYGKGITDFSITANNNGCRSTSTKMVYSNTNDVSFFTDVHEVGKMDGLIDLNELLNEYDESSVRSFFIDGSPSAGTFDCADEDPGTHRVIYRENDGVCLKEARLDIILHATPHINQYVDAYYEVTTGYLEEKNYEISLVGLESLLTDEINQSYVSFVQNNNTEFTFNGVTYSAFGSELIFEYTATLSPDVSEFLTEPQTRIFTVKVIENRFDLVSQLATNKITGNGQTLYLNQDMSADYLLNNLFKDGYKSGDWVVESYTDNDSDPNNDSDPIVTGGTLSLDRALTAFLTYYLNKGGYTDFFQLELVIAPTIGVQFDRSLLDVYCNDATIKILDVISTDVSNTIVETYVDGVVAPTVVMSQLSKGEHSIGVKVRNNAGREGVFTKSFYVNVGVVKFNQPDMSLCSNAASINLVSLLSGNDATEAHNYYADNQIFSGVFDPGSYEVGEHEIRYVERDGYCTKEVTMLIDVLETPNINNLVQDAYSVSYNQIDIWGGTQNALRVALENEVIKNQYISLVDNSGWPIADINYIDLLGTEKTAVYRATMSSSISTCVTSSASKDVLVTMRENRFDLGSQLSTNRVEHEGDTLYLYQETSGEYSLSTLFKTAYKGGQFEVLNYEDYDGQTNNDADVILSGDAIELDRSLLASVEYNLTIGDYSDNFKFFVKVLPKISLQFNANLPTVYCEDAAFKIRDVINTDASNRIDYIYLDGVDADSVVTSKLSTGQHTIEIQVSNIAGQVSKFYHTFYSNTSKLGVQYDNLDVCSHEQSIDITALITNKNPNVTANYYVDNQLFSGVFVPSNYSAGDYEIRYRENDGYCVKNTSMNIHVTQTPDINTLVQNGYNVVLSDVQNIGGTQLALKNELQNNIVGNSYITFSNNSGWPIVDINALYLLGTEKQVVYNATMSSAISSCVSTDKIKSVTITMTENRFDLGSQLSTNRVEYEGDTLYLYQETSGEYTLGSLFKTGYKGGLFDVLSYEDYDGNTNNDADEIISGDAIELDRSLLASVEYKLTIAGYSDSFKFFVKVLPKINLQFNANLPTVYCEDAAFKIREVINTDGNNRIDHIHLDGVAADSVVTSKLDVGQHTIEVQVSNIAGQMEKFYHSFYSNTSKLGMQYNNLDVCSHEQSIDIATIVTNKNPNVTASYYVDNQIFSGVFVPSNYSAGNYEIRYRETDGYCVKNTSMNINVTQTPDINTLVQNGYNVVLSDVESIGGTQEALKNELQNNLVGNSYITFSNNSGWPIVDINTLYAMGTERMAVYTATMSSAISSCVSTDKTKDVTVVMVEDRFKLASQLSTNRVEYEGDTLYLYQEYGGEYSLSSLFKADYRNGIFEVLTYEDNDGNTNNDADVILNGDAFELERTLVANVEYKLTINGFTDVFNFKVRVLPIIKLQFDSNLPAVYCEDAAFKIRDVINTDESNIINYIRLDGIDTDSVVTSKLSTGQHKVEIQVSNVAGQQALFVYNFYSNTKVLDMIEDNMTMCSLDGTIDFSTLLVNKNVNASGNFYLNNQIFSGVFVPSNYIEGNYEVRYREIDGYCTKNTSLNLVLNETPNVDDIILDDYAITMSQLQDWGGTQNKMREALESEIINNLFVSVSNIGTWPLGNIETINEEGSFKVANFRALMSSSISSCVSTDVEKDFTVTITENRFDLGEHLATNKINQRGDTLYLYQQYGGEYSLSNMFATNYNSGSYVVLSYVDFDGNVNNDADPIMNGGAVELDRPLEAKVEYRLTKNGYLNKFMFNVKILPIIKLNFNKNLANTYCQDANIRVMDVISTSMENSIDAILLDGLPEDSIVTSRLAAGNHTLTVFVSNIAGQSETFNFDFYTNTAKLGFNVSNIDLCSTDTYINLVDNLENRNSSISNSMMVDGQLFSGVFIPANYDPGTRNIVYRETDGVCNKETAMTVTLKETPNIDLIIQDQYNLTMSELISVGGTQTALRNYMRDGVIQNQFITIGNISQWPFTDVNTINALGTVKTVSYSGILSSGISECLSSDLSKTFNVNITENRFDLEAQLATTKISQRGDTLYLYQQYSGEYNLISMFKSGYNSGTFNVLSYADYDGNVNNDSDPIMGGSSIDLERPLLAKMEYEFTSGGYTDRFDFYVKVLPIIRLSFDKTLANNYCEDVSLKISRYLTTSTENSIDAILVDGMPEDSIVTSRLASGDHSLSVIVSNVAGQSETFNFEFYTNTSKVRFNVSNLDICSTDNYVDLVDYLENRNSNVTNSMLIDGSLFSGVYIPANYETGINNVVYREVDGVCNKEAAMTVTLKETPNIDLIIQDQYNITMSELISVGGTQTSLRNYIQDNVIKNSYLTIGNLSAWPIADINTIGTMGTVNSVSYNGILSSGASDCLTADLSKTFTVNITENRFDLAAQLATTKINERGDTLYLYQQYGGEYNLASLFKAGYNTGTFNVLSYTDFDGNVNNDSDPIMSGGAIDLERPLLAKMEYEYTLGGYTDRFEVYVKILPIIRLSFDKTLANNYCEDVSLKISRYLTTSTDNRISSILLDGEVTDSLITKDLITGNHELEVIVSNQAGQSISFKHQFYVNTKQIKFSVENLDMCSSDSYVDLTTYIENRNSNISNKMFVENQLFSGVFIPANYDPGIMSIKYQETDGVCNKEIGMTVNLTKTPDINEYVFSNYEFTVSDLVEMGGTQDTLRQRLEEVIIANPYISVSNNGTWPIADINALMALGTSKTAFYRAEMSSAASSCLTANTFKEISVKITENRFDLENHLIGNKITQRGDTLYLYQQVNSEYTFSNIFASGYNTGTYNLMSYIDNDGNINNDEENIITGNSIEIGRPLVAKVAYEFTSGGYTDRFVFYVKVLPIITLKFHSSLMDKYCENQVINIREVFSVNEGTRVDEILLDENATERFETQNISVGMHTITVNVSNEVNQSKTFNYSFYNNSKQLGFIQDQVLLCSGQGTFNVGDLLENTNSTANQLYYIESNLFNGVINPLDYESGAYNVVYRETDGYCLKEANLALNIEHVPNINDYVYDSYDMSMSRFIELGGTVDTVIRALKNEFMLNPELVLSSNMQTAVDKSIKEMGSVIEIPVNVRLKAEVSSCLNTDLTKSFVLRLVENRFDLANHLATNRLEGRDSTLLLCESTEEYRIENIFVEEYRGGTFTVMSYSDYDNDLNNDEDAILGAGGVIELNRPLIAYLSYKKTIGSYTDEFRFFVHVTKRIKAEFMDDIQDSYCQVASFDIDTLINTFNTGHIFSISIDDNTSTSVFNTQNLNKGIHNIKAIIKNDAGCLATLEKPVYVNDEEIFFSVDTISMCHNDPITVDLNTLIAIPGGKFFWRGQQISNIFDPIEFNEGINIIEYRVNDSYGYCEKKAYLIADLIPYPKIETFPVPDVCFAQGVDLKTYVNPKSGSFSYTGFDDNVVNGSMFSPSLAGIGNHVVEYEVSNEQGCSNVVSINVAVNDLLPNYFSWVSKLPNTCKDGEVINLREFVNTDLGTFNGMGVSGDYFYPENGRVGVNSINFNYSTESSGCVLNIPTDVVVYESTKISNSNVPILCYASEEILLEKYVSPKGGIFTGEGILDMSNGLFNTKQTGKGAFDIVYEYTNENGCVTEKNLKVEVDALIKKDRLFDSIPVQCQDGPVIVLEEYVVGHLNNTVNQTSYFSGRGVSEGKFYPLNAGLGKWDVKYTVEEGRCVHEDLTQIRVDKAVGFNFKDIPAICMADSINLNKYVNINGGVFTGRGVVDNYFYPESVGEGVYIIDYFYQFEGSCVISDYKYVEIQSLEPIDFFASDNIIKDGEWVKFESQYSGEQFKWNFSDGDKSEKETAFKYFYLDLEWIRWNEEYRMNEYRMTGNNKHDVILEITKDGCTKRIEKQDVVSVLPQEQNDFIVHTDGMTKKAVVNKIKGDIELYELEAINKNVRYYNGSLYFKEFPEGLEYYIFNINGNVVYQGKTMKKAPIEKRMSSGVYMVRVDGDSYKFIIEN